MRNRQKIFLQAEENNRIRKYVVALENDQAEIRKFKRIINLVSNNFQLRFAKQHLQNLQIRIKDEFKAYYGIENEQDIKINAYGLTGAGVNFINSTIKVQVRFKNTVKRFEQLVNDLKKKHVASHQQEGEENAEGIRLIPTSWFVVKYVKEQHLYLQLTRNDYSEEYNGVVFKVKFQHMQQRREFLTAKLLNLYVFLDRNKFLPLAYFWLFFLKVNGFVGEKRGYLSSTSYLIMLINYLQGQFLLPNFQDRKQSEQTVMPTDYMNMERLTKEEMQKFKAMLTEENLSEKLTLDLLSGEQAKTSRFVEIDAYINDDPQNRQLLLDNLKRARYILGSNRKQFNENIFINFIKFLVLRLPERSVAFNIKKGLISRKR